MKSVVVVVLGSVAACFSQFAAAKTAVEIGMTGLSYSTSKSETELEDTDITSDETKLRTLEPDWTVSVYADKFYMDFGLESGEDPSGTLQGGWGVSPNVYVGAIIAIDNSKEKEEEETNGVETQTESETKSMSIGPLVHYRKATEAAIVEAYGAIAQFNIKGTAESGNVESESNVKMMALALAGGYLARVADRFYMGAGIGYTMSLSGDAEQKQGGVEADGDFSYNELTLNLLQFKVEI